MDDIKKSLEKLSDKMDKALESDNKRDITLAQLTQISEINSKSLQDHIQRTNLLEERVELVRAEVHKDIEPIQNHVTQIQGFGKGIKWIAFAIGLIGSITALYLKFFS